jgi:hypothetical protein
MPAVNYVIDLARAVSQPDTFADSSRFGHRPTDSIHRTALYGHGTRFFFFFTSYTRTHTHTRGISSNTMPR